MKNLEDESNETLSLSLESVTDDSLHGSPDISNNNINNGNNNGYHVMRQVLLFPFYR